VHRHFPNRNGAVLNRAVAGFRPATCFHIA
jgi:hypothetical protein